VRAEAGAAVINDEKQPQVAPPALSPWSALLTCPDLAPQWFNAALKSSPHLKGGGFLSLAKC